MTTRTLREEIALVLLHVYAARATKVAKGPFDVDWHRVGSSIWVAAGEVEESLREAGSDHQHHHHHTVD